MKKEERKRKKIEEVFGGFFWLHSKCRPSSILDLMVGWSVDYVNITHTNNFNISKTSQAPKVTLPTLVEGLIRLSCHFCSLFRSLSFSHSSVAVFGQQPKQTVQQNSSLKCRLEFIWLGSKLLFFFTKNKKKKEKEEGKLNLKMFSKRGLWVWRTRRNGHRRI